MSWDEQIHVAESAVLLWFQRVGGISRGPSQVMELGPHVILFGFVAQSFWKNIVRRLRGAQHRAFNLEMMLIPELQRGSRAGQSGAGCYILKCDRQVTVQSNNVLIITYRNPSRRATKHQERQKLLAAQTPLTTLQFYCYQTRSLYT
jgi:hypothetical protein